ncbi:MAG: hypothetical protein KDI79_13240 [Anaerolineae bacterium]|nr:hypothetical protein [Anaerolineae bacterium]
MVRLRYDAHGYGWLGVALINQTTPSVVEIRERDQNLSVNQIIIFPYLLFDGQACQPLLSQIESRQHQSPFAIAATPTLSTFESLIDVLLAQYTTALKDRRLVPVRWEEVDRQLYRQPE